MFFEAILFLAGAVLFLLAVIFFVFLWQDRLTLVRRREAMQAEVAHLKEQRVDLDIREHELRVWAEGLEHQQLAIAKAEEELRMLTATKRVTDGPGDDGDTEVRMDDGTLETLRSVTKNVKQRASSRKLHERA